MQTKMNNIASTSHAGCSQQRAKTIKMDGHLIVTVLLGVMGLGCGPDFSGSFAGPLAVAARCSDGSAFSTDIDAAWSLQEDATLTLMAGGACDPLTAKTAGNVATLQHKTCPQRTLPGGIINNTNINSGSLTLVEPNLSVTMSITERFSSGIEVLTCNENITGMLIRRN